MEYTKSTDYTIEDRYLRFNTFFKSEKLSSTYKPAFVKSLIATSYYDEQNLHRLIGHKWITRQDDKLKVDLNFIVIRYIQYFWELYFKFRLKQSHSPQDANINRDSKDIEKYQDTYPEFLSRRRILFPQTAGN